MKVTVELCDGMANLLDRFGKILQAKEPVELITLSHVVKIEDWKGFEDDECMNKKVMMIKVVTSSKSSWKIMSLKLGDLETSKDSSQKVLKKRKDLEKNVRIPKGGKVTGYIDLSKN